MDYLVATPLAERKSLEDLGLVQYVENLLERRWTDPNLRGHVFAIANSDHIYVKTEAKSIGNQSYLCSIILPDPGSSLVLVIFNRPAAFQNLCATATPSIFPNPLVILKKEPQTIVAVNHNALSNCTRTSHIRSIPFCLEPFVLGIFRVYRAKMRAPIMRDDECVNFVVRPDQPSPIYVSDFAPLSGSQLAIESFRPFYPNLWHPPIFHSPIAKLPIAELPTGDCERSKSAPISIEEYVRESTANGTFVYSCIQRAIWRTSSGLTIIKKIPCPLSDAPTTCTPSSRAKRYHAPFPGHHQV